MLGEGERPLLELAARLRAGAAARRASPARRSAARTAACCACRSAALDRDELRDAIFSTPYEKMPYEAYWERLEAAYRVGALPTKAAREARLAEIRSVRLITLNYCPMGCTFCSSTNFLHEAQGSVAPIARLDADEVLQMIERIVAAHPRVRTIIFQDDIFVFTKDQRVLPLCEGIVAAKARGALPRASAVHQHQSHRCDDASSASRPCAAPASACSASASRTSRRDVLAEFNKAQIHRHIEPMLTAALDAGHHAVPRSDPELAARLARGRGGDAARSVSLAATGLRDRHVSVRHSVLGRGVRAAIPTLAPHTSHARPARRRHRASNGSRPRRSCPSIRPCARSILRIERDFEDDAGASCRTTWRTCPRACARWCGFCARVPVLAEHGIADRG